LSSVVFTVLALDLSEFSELDLAKENWQLF
jgi:hypothetical protein